MAYFLVTGLTVIPTLATRIHVKPGAAAGVQRYILMLFVKMKPGRYTYSITLVLVLSFVLVLCFAHMNLDTVNLKWLVNILFFMCLYFPSLRTYKSTINLYRRNE